MYNNKIKDMNLINCDIFSLKIRKTHYHCFRLNVINRVYSILRLVTAPQITKHQQTT